MVKKWARYNHCIPGKLGDVIKYHLGCCCILRGLFWAFGGNYHPFLKENQI